MLLGNRSLVVGGSGFIGKALQARVLDRGSGDAFAFTYFNNSEGVKDSFEKFKLDLMTGEGTDLIKGFKTAIYVSGQSSGALSRKDPYMDLQLNVEMLLNFVRYFRGNLLLLSSQAVYYGLSGKIPEKVDHVPVVPYGLTKRMSEMYAEYLAKLGLLERLWTFRLLYTYGHGESPRRLVPMCNWAASTGGKVTIHGKGRSYLNPLPVGFVADVLLNAVEDLEGRDKGYIELTNLNHPKKMTTMQVVKILSSAKKFEYEVEDEGEIWPVEFYGDTGYLERHMKEWSMTMPDAEESLRRHFLGMNLETKHAIPGQYSYNRKVRLTKRQF